MPSNDLILRIGATLGPLKAALKQAERSLLSTGRKLESIGADLSVRLSAPIVAAGAASVKAFADFEKLEKSLAAVSGSAGEAEATLSRLRKLALQPGIDLQNAVTASIRLQAVGFEAQRAEDLILQFSKAVTLAGGTGEDLGEVVRQITQIISKGKILASDFRVIQERVPAIGIALQNAFGTTNIEQIREAGISAEDFIAQLTEGIRTGKEFQNVQGGIGNALNNFQQSIEASLVTLGRTIVETVDLEKVLDDISNTISRVADAFAGLDPETKKNILTIGGLVAAIGPLLLGIGAVLKVLPLLRIGFATLLGPVGLISAAVALLVGEFISYKLELTAAEKAQKAVNNALSTASQRTEEERSKVNQLIDVIRSETATKGEKAEAIERLKRISPEYFGGLDIEKVKTEELTRVSEDYNKSLKTRNELQEINAKSQAAQEELVKVQKQLAAASALAQKQAGGQFGVYAGGANEASAQVRKLEKRTQELQESIKAFADEAQRVSTDFSTAPTEAATSSATTSTPIAAQTTGTSESSGFIPDTSTFESSLKQTNVFARAVRDNLSLIGEAFNSATNTAEDSFRAIGGSISEFTDSVGPVQTFVDEYRDKIEEIAEKQFAFGSSFDGLNESINLTRTSLENAVLQYGAASTQAEFYRQKLSELNEELTRQQNQQQLVSQGVQAAANAFSTAADSQEKGLKGLAKAAKASAREFIKAQLAQAIAGLAKTTIAQFGLLGIPLAIGGAAAVGALFNTLIPALAEGGVVTGPTLALIGEGRENEVVLPLSKLDNLLANNQSQERLLATVGIDELYIALERYKLENGRVN